MFSSRTPNSTHHLAARRCVPRPLGFRPKCEGQRFAARLGVLLHGGRAPRARSEVRCGWSKSHVLEDDEPADEKKLMLVGYG